MTELENLLEQNTDEINLFVNNTTIGEVGAIYLQRHIRQHPTVTILELKGSTIGQRGADYLASAINGNGAQLRHLGLARNHINTAGAVSVVKALHNTAIETLDLEWNTLQDPVAFALADLLDVTQSLVAITVERNDLRADGIKALAKSLKTNKTLRNLNLGFNKIGSLGAQYLGEMLGVNRTLLTINLAMNAIYPDGAKFIAEGLVTNDKLRSINLQTNSAIDAFAELPVDQFWSPAMKEISFSANRLQPQLAASFGHKLRSARGLLAISLSKCGVGEPAITPIIEGLSYIISLVTVDLSSCGLSANSASLIANLLASCPSVRSLFLDDNRLDASGGEIVCNAISLAPVLTVLSLNGCIIGPQGAVALAASIRARRGLTLAELRVAHNRIGDDAMYVLCDALTLRVAEGECNLTAFDVSGNEISSRMCTSFARLLKFHTKLASVTVRDNRLATELHDISFLTLSRALEYTGPDVVKAAEATTEDQRVTNAASNAARSAAMYSNFNGTSAAFTGSLAAVPDTHGRNLWTDLPGEERDKRRSVIDLSNSTDPMSAFKPKSMTAKVYGPGEDEEHVNFDARHHSPAEKNSPSRRRRLSSVGDAMIAVEQGTTLTDLVRKEEDFVPGLSPARDQSVFKHRTQLHQVENNPMLLPINETQLRLKFQEFDVDHNGYLDANEFARLYTQMDPVAVDPSGKQIKRLTKELAKDGKIYFEAFSIMMLKLFKA